MSSSTDKEIMEKELLKKLEKDGEEEIKKLKAQNFTTKYLVEVMKKGADEFKEKTGRNMTYSEMREAYG